MVKETEELILTRCLVCAWFGCPEESNYHNRDKETIKFIEKARNKQGWKYNYKNTVYVRSKDKVTIKCEEHGEFKQRASGHSSGRGCNRCGGSAPYDTKSFIKKANMVHNNKYDYSKVDYKNSKTKVTIICKLHGEFKQIPYDHSSGHGCNRCGGTMLSDTESFIENSNKVHNNRYDYSKVDYKNSNTKVTIICKLHKEFTQTPGSHLSGNSCPTCAGNKRSDTESFIKKANRVHDNKYDYSKVDYKNNNTKVTIICKVHGEFKQRAGSHSRGNGCPTCGGTMLSDTESFIENSNKVHNNRYDYSKVDYKNSNTKVTIICKLHGEFKQIPNNHSSGQGCPMCGNKLSDTESFIKKANRVHDNKYDYSKVDYKNNKTKVTIICKVHGDFQQTPNNHSCGNGCPHCQSSKGELAINMYLIKNKINFESQYKIEKYRYDCFIPFINTLIEYDGKGPHFKWDTFHCHKQAKRLGISPQQAHQRRKTMDLKKTKLALEQGYKIVRIPYTEYETIDTILQSILESPRNLIVSSNKEEINSIYKAHIDLTTQHQDLDYVLCEHA